VTNEDSNYEKNFWLDIGSFLQVKRVTYNKNNPQNPFGIEQFYSVTTMMQTIAEKAFHAKQAKNFMKVQETIDYQLATGEKAEITKLGVSVITSRDV